MKIVHVCAGAEANNGAAVIAAGFARAQAKAGHEVLFVATSLSPEPARVDLTGVRPIVFARSRLPVLRQLCFSWGLFRELKKLCADADLVVTHCQWTFPVWWAARCARRRLVMVPEGSFDPVRLRYGAWRKRLAGVFDRAALRKAETVVALSSREEDWIRAYLGRRGDDASAARPQIVRRHPVIEIPPLSAAPRAEGDLLRVLYLGRRHPLKGLDLLAEAAKGLQVEVRVEDALFGAEKESAFDWCDLLCLPTRSENYGLVVAEALARGKPVLTTTAAPWEGVVERRCGWWVQPDAAAVRAALAEAVELHRTSPEALREMGRRGRAWMEESASCMCDMQ